jgi:hypothetical protein
MGTGGHGGGGPSALCVGCLSFRVGAPTALAGPSGTIADSVLQVIPVAGALRAYTANGTTYRLDGASVDALSLNLATPALPAPMAASKSAVFDACGRWLQAVQVDSNVVRGFYHAEDDCDYANNQTNKSVAYAESHDGGQTFTLPGYPNNQVLTGTNAPATGQITGAGDHGIVAWHGSYWMYFVNWVPGAYGTGVATAPIASGGTPGSWHKYHGGSFSEPALGGQATILGVYGTAVTHYVPADALMLIVDEPGAAFGGMHLRFSTDGIAWTSMDEPLVVLDQESWARSASSLELHAYPGIVPAAGGKDWSDGFFYAYTYLAPGADFSQRYLVVRQVNVAAASAPASPQVTVELTRYFSNAVTHHWVTTALPLPLGSYAKEFSLGHLFTKGAAGMVEIYECLVAAYGDHMMSLDPACEGQTKVRSLGWVYASMQPGTVPLNRCYYGAWHDHWAANVPCDQGAPGVMTELTLGYVLP